MLLAVHHEAFVDSKIVLIFGLRHARPRLPCRMGSCKEDEDKAECSNLCLVAHSFRTAPPSSLREGWGVVKLSDEEVETKS